MSSLGNVIWFICGGWFTAIFVYIFGLALTVTVVASSVGLGLMELGKFLFFPFGHVMINKNTLVDKRPPVILFPDFESAKTPKEKFHKVLQLMLWIGWRALTVVVYAHYLIVACLAAFCLIIQIILLCFSIVGIPIAVAIAKALPTLIYPINKKCISARELAVQDMKRAHKEAMQEAQ